MKSYRDLLVWQRAISLVKEIYTISRTFPSEERFGLTSQIRRAAVSIPSNIAEGQGRGAQPKEFSRFLRVALGSLAELDTQIEISRQLAYINEDEANARFKDIEEIRKMVYGLINSLSTR